MTNSDDSKLNKGLPKSKLTLSINLDIKNYAKEKGLNLSQIMEDTLYSMRNAENNLQFYINVDSAREKIEKRQNVEQNHKLKQIKGECADKEEFRLKDLKFKPQSKIPLKIERLSKCFMVNVDTLQNIVDISDAQKMLNIFKNIMLYCAKTMPNNKSKQTTPDKNVEEIEADYTIEGIVENTALIDNNNNKITDFSKYDDLPYATWQELEEYYKELYGGKLPTIDEIPYKDDIEDFNIIDYLTWSGKIHTNRKTGEQKLVVFNGFPVKHNPNFDKFKSKKPELTQTNTDITPIEDEDIYREIKTLKCLVNESILRQNFGRNLKVCEVARQHEEGLRKYIGRNIKKSTLDNKMRFLLSPKRCPFQNPKELLYYKDTFKTNIDINDRTALISFFDYLLDIVEIKEFNNIPILEWKDKIKKMQIKRRSERVKISVKKNYTNSEIIEYFDLITNTYDKKLLLFALYTGMRLIQATEFLKLTNKTILYEDDEIVVYDGDIISTQTKRLHYVFVPKCCKNYAERKLDFPPKMRLNRKNGKERMDEHSYYPLLNKKLSDGTTFSSKSLRKFSANAMYKATKCETKFIDMYQSRWDKLSICDRHYLNVEDDLLDYVKQTHKYLLSIVEWNYK